MFIKFDYENTYVIQFTIHKEEDIILGLVYHYKDNMNFNFYFISATKERKTVEERVKQLVSDYYAEQSLLEL